MKARQPDVEEPAARSKTRRRVRGPAAGEGACPTKVHRPTTAASVAKLLWPWNVLMNF